MSIEASLAEKAAALVPKAEQRRASRTPPWQPFVWGDLAEGQILAFDQTFSKTGWVLVSNVLGFEVVEKGFLQQPPIPDTLRFFDVLQRTEWMGEQIEQTIQHCLEVLPGLEVVHEMPILQGMRVESSLLGATKVWEACKAQGLPKPTIVSKTRVAAVLCPPGERKGKNVIKQGLMRHLDVEKGWNEHNRDALGLAIARLIDKKKAAGA